jgi:hypothetical protein
MTLSRCASNPAPSETGSFLTETRSEDVRPVGASTTGNGPSWQRLIRESLARFDVNDVAGQRDTANARLVSVFDSPGGTPPVIVRCVQDAKSGIE